MLRNVSSIVALSVAMLFLVGCPPKYPNCKKDDHCKEGEYCVNQMCQQCRSSTDCPKGQQCNKGRCDPIPGYCEDNNNCPAGQVCTDNRCGPCAQDSQCGPGSRCSSGKCLQPGQCESDADCPENHECQSGSCVAPPVDTAVGTDPCSKLGMSPLPTIFFDFDEFVLTSEATSGLQQAADCLKKVPNMNVRMEGHCDPRGTEEYNLALGDRRSRSVKRYLKRLGVPSRKLRTVSKGKLEATGYNEASWSKDRKVVFIWE